MALLLLVDIENLCNMGSPTTLQIRNAKILLDVLAGTIQSEDKYIIGCNPAIKDKVEEVWIKSGSRKYEIYTRPGKNGADKAIRDWVKTHLDELESWYQIVIASGDGFFAEDFFRVKVYRKFHSRNILQVVNRPGNRNRAFSEFSHRTLWFGDVFYGDFWKTTEVISHDTLGRTIPFRVVEPKRRATSTYAHPPRPFAVVPTRRFRMGDEQYRALKWEKNENWLFGKTFYVSSEKFVLISNLKRGQTFEIVDRDGQNIIGTID